MADLNRRGHHWFLPDTPDVLGMLEAQLKVTVEGVDAFARWARGGGVTLAELDEIESRGDDAKRELLKTLRAAFVTPIEPEDVFMLSRESDWILNAVGDVVAESEALGYEPEPGLEELAGLLASAVGEIGTAVSELGSPEEASTAAADRAIAFVRELEEVYFRAMAATLEVDERAERIARRELYRRCLRISETLTHLADRTVYVVVRAS